MAERVHLSVDGRGRVSVQKLGFQPSSVIVAERNEDGSVVLRQGKVLTEAEIDFLSSPESRHSLDRGMKDLKHKRIEPPSRSR